MQYVILFFLSLSLFAAQTERYDSGLIRTYEATEKESAISDELRSITRFRKDNFSFLNERHQWKEVAHFSDNTHSHRISALYYEGRRVTGHYVKTHYNRKGFLEYASSSLSHPVEGYVLPVSTGSQIYWQTRAKEDFEKQFRRPLNGGVRSEPVVYIDDETGQVHSALEMHLVNDSPLYIRHFIIEEQTGRVLAEKKYSRQATASAKIYKVSPFNSATAETVTLTVDAADKLKNSNFYVRREQDTSSPTLVDITPADYTASINSDPAQYSYSCTGSNTTCADHAFDGVNVYYHLSRFRDRMGSYFTDLGATVTLPGEPIPVIVNTLTLGEYTVNDLSNNASYVTGCRSDGSMPRCMVFLRPARISASSSEANCGLSTPVQFYDFAREAIVIAHEYQHYITDSITSIEFGCSSSGSCAVGDALHEAISDYLAATYVTDVAGRDVTLVGEYALQNCSALQRQLNTLKVYEDVTATKDPHVGGWSWASGYWKLKTETDSATTDKLVIKSLFYLPTRPSFYDSVESLVKADNALYGGAHVSRIRQLFYDDLKVVAGQSGTFRDTARGIIEMGNKGCSSVGYSARPISGLFTALLFFVWFFTTRWIGKKGDGK